MLPGTCTSVSPGRESARYTGCKDLQDFLLRIYPVSSEPCSPKMKSCRSNRGSSQLRNGYILKIRFPLNYRYITVLNKEINQRDVLYHIGGVPDSTGCVQSQVACRACPMNLVKNSSWIKSSWQQLLIPTGCVKQLSVPTGARLLAPFWNADLNRLFRSACLLRGWRT